MLIIAMHNRRDYLEALLSLVRKHNITNSTIIEQKNIGTRLIGENTGVIFNTGKALSAYDKALIAVVRDENVKNILNTIEDDTTLRLLNLEDKGFICTVPFQQVRNLEVESPQTKKGGSRMKISNFLKEEKIILNLKAKDKGDAIKEIGSVLEGSKEIVDFQKFISDVFERESLSTTAIGNGIAIPHARTDAVNDFIIAFGRAPDGLDFDALDDKPVKLVFLMGTPKQKEVGSYLRILAHLTRLLQKQQVRDSLLHASTPKQIVGVFEQFEK